MTEHIIIDAKKDVMVPETLRESITQWDHEIQEIIIDCPRYWYYEKDIYGLQFYVNYLTSKNAKGKKTLSTPCTVTLGDTEDMLQITWPIRRSLSQYDGPFAFLLCAKGVDENGNETPRWNSHLCKDMTIMEGLESNLQEMVEEYPDVITSLLLRVDALEKNGVGPGGGTSFSGSAADVTYDNTNSGLDADNAQEAIDKLSEEMDDLKLSSDIVFESVTDGEVMTSTEESTEEPDTPIEPDVTVSSISATYSGGNVTVGTTLTDLSGITVTATYSDGSTANVTNYTLSGEIVEGNNTITVSYEGKTTTFVVVGVAESGNESFGGSGTLVRKVTNDNGVTYFDVLDVNRVCLSIDATNILLNVDSYKNEYYQNYRINNSAITKYLDMTSNDITNSLIPQVASDSGANSFVNNTAEGDLCSINNNSSIFVRLPIDLNGHETAVEYIDSTYGHLPLAMNSGIIEKVVDPNLITSITIKTDDDTMQYAQFGYSDLPSANIYGGFCSLCVLTGSNANLTVHVAPRFAMSTGTLSCKFEPNTFEEFTLENVKQYLTENPLIFWYLES